MEDQSIGPSGGGLEKKEKYVRLRMAGQRAGSGQSCLGVPWGWGNQRFPIKTG